MNKQSVILTKWVTDSNTLLEDYSQLSLLLAEPCRHDMTLSEETMNSLTKIESMLTAVDVGTKWKLTLEKIEE
jgi:hypothetical protein